MPTYLPFFSLPLEKSFFFWWYAMENHPTEKKASSIYIWINMTRWDFGLDYFSMRTGRGPEGSHKLNEIFFAIRRLQHITLLNDTHIRINKILFFCCSHTERIPIKAKKIQARQRERERRRMAKMYMCVDSSKRVWQRQHDRVNEGTIFSLLLFLLRKKYSLAITS